MASLGYDFILWKFKQAKKGGHDLFVTETRFVLADRYYDAYVSTEETEVGFVYTVSQYTDKDRTKAEHVCIGAAISIEAARASCEFWMRSMACKVVLNEFKAKLKNRSLRTDAKIKKGA